MPETDAALIVQSMTDALARIASLQGTLLDGLAELKAAGEELAGDVAELGGRVSLLERERRNEGSLRVVGREHFASLDELAAVLRAEVADELAAIDKRITEVHDPALRALTALVERKHPA